MKLKSDLLHLATVFVVVNSCTKNPDRPNSEEKPAQQKAEKKVIVTGDYCFRKIENKDSTIVRFRVLSSDDIRGEMIWRPYQKDGATGTLTGKMISDNEI